jgi:hypothetical protein
MTGNPIPPVSRTPADGASSRRDRACSEATGSMPSAPELSRDVGLSSLRASRLTDDGARVERPFGRWLQLVMLDRLDHQLKSRRRGVYQTEHRPTISLA